MEVSGHWGEGGEGGGNIMYYACMKTNNIYMN